MKLFYIIYNFFLKFYNYIEYNSVKCNSIKCKKNICNKMDLLNPIIIILDNGNKEEYFSIIV